MNWGPVHTYPDIFESATFSDTATVHTHPANSAANPDIFKSALQNGKKICHESDNVWTGESGLFGIRWRSKFVSVSYRAINWYGGITATTGQIWRHYRALYGACCEHILLQSSPGYYSEFGYHRMRVDRCIRFEYATCGRGNFWIWKEKVANSEISETVWTGPEW